MFSFFNSFGASSNFQKHRLLLTTKNYEAPDQTSLKKIIQTFRGQDQQTRSQIAFATIIKKIHTSDSNDNWIYLLKNLIILDRVVQENCFLDEIAALVLQPIQNYQENHEHAKVLNSQRILKTLWKLIQIKSRLLCHKTQARGVNYFLVPNDQKEKRKNSFNKTSSVSLSKSSSQKKSAGKVSSQTSYDSERSIVSIVRSQKQQFLKSLTVQQIHKQSQQLQMLFEYVFQLIKSIQLNIQNQRVKKPTNRDETRLNEAKLEGGKLQGNQTISEYQINIKVSNHNRQQPSSSLYQNLLTTPSGSSGTQQKGQSNQKYKAVREQFFNSKLVNYLHSQLLYKLYSLYTNQYFCTRAFIDMLIGWQGKGNFTDVQQRVPMQGQLGNDGNKQLTSSTTLKAIQEKEIVAWKKVILNYLDYSQKIINYVQRHKWIKGFDQINYKQLSPFQNVRVIDILDEYIRHKNTSEEPDMVKVEWLGSITGGDNNQIKVERKAQWSSEKRLTSRKMMVKNRKSLKDKNNPFNNWQNSYSGNFPQKQVLTVDLIMELRQKAKNPTNQASQLDDDDQSIYHPFVVNRHSCIYSLRESNINIASEFQFTPIQQMSKKQEQLQSIVPKQTKNFYYFKNIEPEKCFRNIYSSLAKDRAIWVK